MRQNGLKVDSIKGDFVVHPIQATDDPTEIDPVDVVLVGVKTWQVPEAAKAMRPVVGPETLAFLDSLPPSGTASMQRDIMEGRPSELEAQTGAAFRLGQAVGIAPPLNTFIYNSLLPLELKARDQVQFMI